MENKTYTATLKNSDNGYMFLTMDVNYFNEETSLQDAQKAVGGYIENLYWPKLDKMDIVAYCNEEGKYKGLPPTLNIYENNKRIDVVVGNIFFESFNRNTGDPKGLNKEQVEYLINSFNEVVGINYIDCGQDFKD